VFNHVIGVQCVVSCNRLYNAPCNVAATSDVKQNKYFMEIPGMLKVNDWRL